MRFKFFVFHLLLGALLWISQPAHAATVRVMHGWPAQQGEAFAEIVKAFEAQHPDIKVMVEVVGRNRPAVLATRLAAGNPPDITPHPWLGLQARWAAEKRIIPLEGRVDDAVLLESLRPLGYVNGKLYGLFVFPSVKSLIWYNPKIFQTKGYAVPDTWDELMTLCKQMIRNKDIPWSIGLESGAASGWPGTDWIEDILLRQAGPEIYDKWMAHKISWTHPAVKTAFETYGNIARDPAMVLGGATGMLTTNFGDAPSALFTRPPMACLHRQASFIQGFIQQQNPGLVPGKDFDVFPFPPFTANKKARGPSKNPLLIGGDVINCFSDRPEVMMFAGFLISRTAQEIWVKKLGELSSNRHTNPDLFTNPITRKTWAMLSTAAVTRYDASDMMPGAVGNGTFWTGMLDYISGEPLDTVLETIEASAKEAYSK